MWIIKFILAHKGLNFCCHGYVDILLNFRGTPRLQAMSQPPLVVVELTTDVNSTVEHLQELGEHIAYPWGPHHNFILHAIAMSR